MFDYLANHETRREQIGVILDHWRSLSDKGVPKDPRPILLGQDGLPDTEMIELLLKTQDQAEFMVFE